MGSSSRPVGATYTLTSQADRMAAVLDSLGAGRVIVVAHSTSASIAFASRCAGPSWCAASSRSTVVRPRRPPCRASDDPAVCPAVTAVRDERRIEKMFRDNFIGASGDTSWVTDEAVRQYSAGSTANPGATIDAFRGMAASHEPQRLDGNLHHLRIPVRLLVGGAPHSSGASAAEIAQLDAQISDFSADTLPGVGHYIHEERPEAVVAAVRRLDQS